MKKILTMLIACVLFFSCSKDEGTEETTQNTLSEKLTNGYFISDDDEAIRFRTDGYFEWMERNSYRKYDRPEMMSVAKWEIDEDGNVIIVCDDETGSMPDDAPSFIYNINFSGNKLYFTNQEGENKVMENKEVSNLLQEEMIGHTFKAGIDYQYGGQKYRAVHTLTFDNEIGTAEWSVEWSYKDSGTVRNTYSAQGYYYTNISRDEIYFYWFYDNGEIPPHSALCPPENMVNMRHETSPSGEWLIYFDGGYTNFGNVNFVRQ